MSTSESQQPSPSFRLRLATFSDLPQIVSLQFECFSQNILIEKIANPDTPENRQSMLERHHVHMEDPGCKVVVAVTSDEGDDAEPDAKSEKIVGFCMFYYPIASEGGEVSLPIPLRRPPAPESPGRTTDAKGQTPTTTTSTSVATIPPPARSPAPSEPARIPISRTNIPALLPYRFSTLQRLLATAPNGAGYIRYMSVSPSYRRHGVGRSLMDWGCSRFDEAGVPAYLEATVEGETLYRRYGFETVGEQVLEVYGVDGKEVVMEDRYACMWRVGKEG